MKNNEEYNFHDQSIDTIDEFNQLTEKSKSKYNTLNVNQDCKKSSTDYPIMKNFANIFVGLMLVLLLVVLLSFIPMFYKFCKENPKLKNFSDNKSKLKYISNMFSELDTFTKFICIAAHILLYIIAISLKSFSDFRNTRLLATLFDTNNYFKYACITFNFFTMLLLLFSPDPINTLLKNNKEFPIFFLYATSVVFLEIYLNRLASLVKSPSFTDNVSTRNKCVYINMIQFTLYIFAWVALQFFPLENKLQHFLNLVLIISVNLNSFLFFFSFLFFVYLLKNTLEQITVELKIKHPEEYYFDYSNSNKNML